MLSLELGWYFGFETNLKQKASVNVYMCHSCFEVVVLDLTVFQQTLLWHGNEDDENGGDSVFQIIVLT